MLPLDERIDLTERRLEALTRIPKGGTRAHVESLRRILAELYEEDGTPERLRTSDYMLNSDHKRDFA